ncbi:MAG: hypothetical protein M3Z27_08330, partial [Actinomycetota bacterium]|nr:hypothetical protein [Actinomycetota bacterium]
MQGSAVGTSGLSAGRYTLGVVALAIVAGSLGYAALALRRRWLPSWAGAPARLAETVIGLALLTALLQLLGAVGLFRLGPIVAGAALIAWGTLRALPGYGRAHPRGAAGGAAVPWRGLAVMAVAAGTVAAEWAGPTLISYRYGIRTFDSLWYHLPWAASFAQSGVVTTLHFTDVEYLTAFYPATAELFHGLGIVLFGGDLLSAGMNLGWLALVLLAAFCAGIRAGVAPLTLLGGALAMATPMLLLSQAGSAANDVVGVFFLVAAVALVLHGPEQPAARVLAAVAAGLAVSVKLSLLAPVLALTVGMLLWGRDRRSPVRWLVPLALASGFWYLRNLVAVGNPLPWLNLPGLAVPAAPLQADTGFSLAHYLIAGHVWQTTLQPGLAAGLGSWWWALLAAAAIGPLLCLLPGATAPVRLLGAVALTSLLAYVVTPESAAGPAGHPLGFAFNLRYSAPALTLSLVALPLAPAWRLPAARAALAVALGAMLLATVADGRFWPGGHLAGQLIVAILAVGAVLLAALGRPHVRGVGIPALARTLALAVALVAVAGLGLLGARDYFRSRYELQPGISHLSPVWALFRRIEHARVGIVGTYGGFFAYPLFGLKDTNRVQYVAARGAHGSFSAIGSCARWRAAVNAARLGYLVTTPARDPWRPRVLTSSPEAAWTAGDPAATVAYSA